jgi:hypothetical protein
MCLPAAAAVVVRRGWVVSLVQRKVSPRALRPSGAVPAGVNGGWDGLDLGAQLLLDAE